HPKCVNTMEKNIQSNIKLGVKDHRDLKDYFYKVIVKDPVVEKSNSGAYVVAFEEIDKKSGRIHWAYPSWDRCNMSIAEKKGNRVTFQCETGGEMKNIAP
ncbi:MAG: hypothetical protein ABIA63_07640, partial [bacterium]